MDFLPFMISEGFSVENISGRHWMIRAGLLLLTLDYNTIWVEVFTIVFLGVIQSDGGYLYNSTGLGIRVSEGFSKSL